MPAPQPTAASNAGSGTDTELELDAVVVPVSGGGLISGIATVVKALAPNCKVCRLPSTCACDIVRLRTEEVEGVQLFT